jgi:hypothetical protein
MRRLAALLARETGNAFDDIRAQLDAGWALTAKPASQFDRPHPGGIAVRAHIRFDETSAVFDNDLANSFFQSGVIDDVLKQGETGRRLLIDTAYDDQPMLKKPRAFSKSSRGSDVRNDRMAIAGLRARKVARHFETTITIDQQHQFPTESEEGDVRVRAKAAFAGKANASIRRVHETRRDLGPSRIKLEARALDLSTERAEGVRVHANGQAPPSPSPSFRTGAITRSFCSRAPPSSRRRSGHDVRMTKSAELHRPHL